MTRLRLVPALTDDGFDWSPSSPIRIVLADDHGVVRRSLRLLLEGEDDVEVIAEADNFASALEHVDGCRERCVLVIDRRMAADPGEETETVDKLRDQALNAPVAIPLDTPVVILSMHDNPVFAQRAFAGGALGFVLKDRADEELPQAVRAAARGEEYVSPRVADRLEALRRPPP
jgi:two-component system, NarL family, response regulator NreC